MCRRVEVKKAWAVHLAEQQQKQQQGSDAEEEDAETSAVDAAEVHRLLSAITSYPRYQTSHKKPAPKQLPGSFKKAEKATQASDWHVQPARLWRFSSLGVTVGGLGSLLGLFGLPGNLLWSWLMGPAQH